MQSNTHHSSRRSARVEPNTFFFSGYNEDVVRGIRFDELLDPKATHNIALPTMVIGPKNASWARYIRPGKNDAPLYDFNKVWRTSIIKDPTDEKQRRDIMVEYRDENANYVLVRTGVRLVERGGTSNKMNFWQQLADRNVRAVTHGAYNFDKQALDQQKSVRVVTAEDIEKIAEGKLSDVPIDVSKHVGSVAAQRLGEIKIGRKIKGVDCPETMFVLWNMPFGSVLLVRDVDGTMSRLISSKTGVERRDATGYESFFEDFDTAYRLAVAAAKAKEPKGDPNYKDGISLKGSGGTTTAA